MKPDDVRSVSIAGGRPAASRGRMDIYSMWPSGLPPTPQVSGPIESGSWEFCRLCATGLAVAINAAKLELQKAVREGRKIGPRQ